jgi:TRAP-type C4-dicarboxylate transport system permease small subunit
VDAWDGWGFQRFYLLFVGAAFFLLGLQVLLFHWRAAFRKWTMYIPILGAPALTVAGIAAALQRDGWIGWAALAFFAIGVIDGLIGIVEHLRGIAERIGGFSLRNLVAGPPPLLPAMFTALAASGGLAIVWGAV